MSKRPFEDFDSSVSLDDVEIFLDEDLLRGEGSVNKGWRKLLKLFKKS